MANQLGSDFPEYTEPTVAESPYPLDEWFSYDGVWCVRYKEDFDCTPQSFMSYMRTKAPMWDRKIELRQYGVEVYFRSWKVSRPQGQNGNGNAVHTDKTQAISGKVDK